jgi:hypothetical protein
MCCTREQRVTMGIVLALCGTAFPGREPAANASLQAQNQPCPETLAGKQFRFTWRAGQASGENGTARLRANGTIAGVGHPNESFWQVDALGRLVFKHMDGRVSTIYTKAERRDGKWFFSGPFQFRQGVEHVLEEVTSEAGRTETTTKAAPSDATVWADLSRVVQGYSTQQIIGLDVHESYTFRLKNGASRVIRLVAVKEHRDSVIQLIRRTDVRVEIDGRPLDLVCAPYVMPTEVAGLRIQADTTTGWVHMPKRVQFSFWDATDPIVDTKRFDFPVRNYRLFSHGTQAYNEPVHLGRGDGDPTGQKFYHNYGFDLAGYDGGEDIVSATDGDVDVCDNGYKWVSIVDDRGHQWSYGHLASIESGITVGARVVRGQTLGVLGRTGASGNFSHLHFAQSGAAKTRLNLYPWIVTAYQAEHPKRLLAVARPHQTILTGEKVLLDGSNSLVFGRRKIVEWRWVFHDGRTVKQARAEKTFDEPGAYVATLWVKDDSGTQDVDFCQVKVFSQANRERGMPHIFMTHTPTEIIRPSQPVKFRFWFQGRNKPGPITVTFGDETRVDDYPSYGELTHSFKAPGIHIVTAQCEAAGRPIESKQKVVVGN